MEGPDADAGPRPAASTRRPSRPRRPRRGWEPYLVPYVAFLVVVQAGAWVSGAGASWLLPVQVAVPALLWAAYTARGCYPELGQWRARAGGLLADLGVGVAVAALWVAPYLAGWIPTPEEGFDPAAWGSDWRGARLALRAVGFVLVTPLVEELFVRSFLIRWVRLLSWRDGRLEIDEARDFRDLPLARYTAWSFWITVVYFGFSHQLWEVPVALLTGAIYNLWLYRRGHLGDVVLAHAVTNGAILALVIAADGGGRDLWYLL